MASAHLSGHPPIKNDSSAILETTEWRRIGNQIDAVVIARTDFVNVHRLMFLRMPGVNRQGQAHIVSPAIRSPGPARGPAEVGGKPWLSPWFSIDPQPASISPTVSISIVFTCALLLIMAASVHRPAI